jgi:hypothetical protein
MSQHFKDIGLGYTSGAKGIETRKYWDHSETSFLKNKIGKMDHLYVARLDINVIYEMLNWLSKSDDPEYFLQVNFNTAQRLAFFHGEEIFNELTNAIKSVRPDATLFTFDHLSKVFKMYQSWGDDVYSPHQPKIKNELYQQNL